jgi:hypothetical protein
MSDSDKGGIGLGGQPPRDVPVDWEALEDAFENNAPEVHSYLHLSTGEVLRVVDGIADPEMHARIASDQSYMRIEPVSSREQYRWMERFIPMVEDPSLTELLTQAIDGKGAFRRFKDVLMSHGAERERWFAFRSERLRVFMEAWLSAHALRPVPRVSWPAEPARAKEKEAAAQSELLGARRVRNLETLRRQLHELVETLGARDLDKVMTFAEFVKARRAARAFAPRGESSESMQDGGEPADAAAVAPVTPEAAPAPAAANVDDDDEQATPSSRKRPAAR